MHYIEKLDNLRAAKNLSFYELGLRCNLSESCIKKIFYRKNVPLVSSIEKLCEVLDISLSELFRKTDEFVFSGSAEAVALISLCNSLSAEAKGHLHGLLKKLQG